MAATLLGAAVPATANAHVLKVDNDIGAVLHINPDDNPSAGTSTDYILSFEDVTGRFSLPKCNCKVSIIEGDKTVATKSLEASGDMISDNQYTFTKSAVYDMRITGKPKTPGAFQSFTLNYEVRVGGVNDNQLPPLLWVGLAMAVSLVLLAAYATSYDSDEVTRRLNRRHQ